VKLKKVFLCTERKVRHNQWIKIGGGKGGGKEMFLERRIPRSIISGIAWFLTIGGKAMNGQHLQILGKILYQWEGSSRGEAEVGGV